MLACPDFSEIFRLQVDASDQDLGAVLIQKIFGQDWIIAYASSSLAEPQKIYATFEKECLAIVWGIQKIRPYFEGYRFTVEMDHQSLKWLLRQSNPRGRLARWITSLQPYDFEVVYRKGVLN